VPQRRLRALDERLPQVCDAEGRAVGVADLEVDDGVDLDIDVVARAAGEVNKDMKERQRGGNTNMTLCRPMGLIWILTSTMRSDSVQTLTWTSPGSTDL
jgi:hypothetical protein